RVTALVQRRDKSVWIGTDGAGIFRIGGDGVVTKVNTDPAIDADFITIFFEDASGTLFIAGVRGLWSWRERSVRVKGLPLPQPRVGGITQVRATGAVLVGSPFGVFRVEADSAVKIRPASITTGARLWTDADGIWNVDGRDVFRDDRKVFTLAER